MYNRIVLKLSGETLAPTEYSKDKCVTFDAERIDGAARVLKDVADLGIQLGVVFGGGNIWRGRLSVDMNPVNADQMGMLATIINALAVQDALTRMGKKAKVFTAQDMPRFADLYRADKVVDWMEEGGIALLAGGTGNPFFTTDTGAVLRGAELKADAVFKGTTVNGVYDSDPKKNPDAKFIPDLTYAEAVEKGIRVMDPSAFQLCREQHVPEMRIFKMDDLENVVRVAKGENLGTSLHE